MNKKIIIAIIVIVMIVIALWFGGVIPKQIGKIYGTKYINDNFPEMQLECENIEW